MSSFSSRASRGIERVTPVPTAEGEILSDSRAATVHASMSTPDPVAGCCAGGGTELKIAIEIFKSY